MRQPADNLSAAYFSPQAEDWLEYIKASSAIPDSTVKGWKLTASHITTAVSVMQYRLLRHGGGGDRIVVIRTVPSQLYYTRNG